MSSNGAIFFQNIAEFTKIDLKTEENLNISWAEDSYVSLFNEMRMFKLT